MTDRIVGIVLLAVVLFVVAVVMVRSGRAERARSPWEWVSRDAGPRIVRHRATGTCFVAYDGGLVVAPGDVCGRR